MTILFDKKHKLFNLKGKVYFKLIVKEIPTIYFKLLHNVKKYKCKNNNKLIDDKFVEIFFIIYNVNKIF